MKHRNNTILGRDRMQFKDNDELRAYYEQKYREGGYEGGGAVVNGVDVSAIYHQRRQATALRFLAAQSHEVILDAGCGEGALAAQLATRCREVHAVDIAENAISPRNAAISNLTFRAMNLEALAYADSYFDKIGSVETLEHLLSPGKAIAEMRRVLKPDGKMVLTYPTINRTLVKRLGLGRAVPISEHLTEWSYTELRERLRNAGFAVEAVEGIAFDFGLLLALKSVNRFLASGITRWSLALRGFPKNSMFVAVLLRKA